MPMESGLWSQAWKTQGRCLLSTQTHFSLEATSMGLAGAPASSEAVITEDFFTRPKGTATDLGHRLASHAVLWSQYVSCTIQMGVLQFPTHEFAA